jgi:outer membrane protein assembly factor BamA
MVARWARGLVTPAALGAAWLAHPARASPQFRTPDPWRPQTVPLIGASYSPGVGLLIGAGLVHTRYGFRALPASTRLLVRVAYATDARTYRADATGQFRQPLAPAILDIEAHVSGLEIIRFHGFGNGTDGSQPDSVYRVRRKQVFFATMVSVPLAPRLRLTLGPLMKYGRTHTDSGNLLASTGPHYGAGDFGQLGARVALERDTRDSPLAAGRGVYLRLAGDWYAPTWDVLDAFGRVSAEASTYFSAGDPPAATLALRAGAVAVSATVPFHEAVYVGGETTVRGYDEQRFGGRRGAYANAELRLLIGRVALGDVGILGLTDAGRVWIPGESSDRWHAAAGGGLWLAWRHRRANTVSVAVAKSPERTAIYLRAGFTF